MNWGRRIGIGRRLTNPLSTRLHILHRPSSAPTSETHVYFLFLRDEDEADDSAPKIGDSRANTEKQPPSAYVCVTDSQWRNVVDSLRGLFTDPKILRPRRPVKAWSAPHHGASDALPAQTVVTLEISSSTSIACYLWATTPY
jgi:hypothetical protein